MAKIPLALLPGTLCNERLFAPQVAALQSVAAPQVIDVTRSDTLPGVAQDVLHAMPERFALAGLSYGGIIALEIIRQAPKRITHLALLNTTHLPPNPATRRKQQQFVGMATTGEFRDITTNYLKDTMLHPAHQTDQALRDIVLEMALSVGVNGFINQVKAQLARPDSTPTLKTITCPTLLLTGREDRVCTVERHEQMAAHIPHARLVIVENCGHLSTLEQPDAVNRALLDWLGAPTRGE